jgi:hypothetical protein
MKKIILFLLLFMPILLSAQAPKAFNYQGIARNTNGQALKFSSMEICISIIDGTEVGKVVYKEHHKITTNQFGLYTLSIGSGAPIFGLFETIEWSLHNKYIKVELLENNKYIDLGTTQLLSVPYALYAETSGKSLNSAESSSSISRAGTPNFLSKFDATGSSSAEINSNVFDVSGNIGVTSTPATTFPLNARVHIQQTTPASNVLLMEHKDSTGFGRFAFYNDAGFANRATFTRYGSKNTGTYPGLNTQFPHANLLAFGCNVGSFLISTNGKIGLSVVNGGTSKLKFFVDSNLRVGIGGNTHPTANVHINNTDGNTDTMRITNNLSGHTGTDGLILGNQGNNAFIINQETANLNLGTSNIVRATINSLGYLGIGTTTPSTNLDIVGQIKISGGNPGNGKVLTSDASGLATWQSIPSGTNVYAGSGIIKINDTIKAIDASSTNELQNLSITGNTLSISNGNNITLPSNTYTAGSGITLTGNTFKAVDTSTTNELQNLSITGNTLSISNGNNITLPSNTYTAGSGITLTGNTFKAIDTSSTNELQNLSITGNTLSISNGNNITLPSNTYTAGSGITLTGNTFKAVDTSSTNELQNLSITGNTLSISNGNNITLPSNTYTAGSGITLTGNTFKAVDTSSTNELQNLSITGNTLSISNGNNITLPSNTYTAGSTTNYIPLFGNNTSNLQNSNIYQSNNKVGIGTTTPSASLQVIGDIKTDTLKTDFLKLNTTNGGGKVLRSDANGNASWEVISTDSTLNGIGTTASPLKIAKQGAANGQVLKWNNTLNTWLPANDNIGADNWGTQLVETDATLNGKGTLANPLRLAIQGAANGQVLKWNNTLNTWLPANDSIGNDWKISGNSGTNALNHFIGNTDSTDLVMRTNNATRLRLQANGNMVLGVSTSPKNFTMYGKLTADTVQLNQIKVAPSAFQNYILVRDTSGKTSWKNPALLETDPHIQMIYNNNVPIYDSASKTLYPSNLYQFTNGMKLNAATHSMLQLNKGGSSFSNDIFFNHQDTTDWTLGTNNGNNLQVYSGTSFNPALTILKSNDNIGIGTGAPLARLHVADSSVLFTGTYPLPSNPKAPPITSVGTRMLWYADKGALFAGTIANPNGLPKDSLGINSFNTGYNNIASGDYAFASGYINKAKGNNTVVMGSSNTVTGISSMALGSLNLITGTNSKSLGVSNSISGNGSIAIGRNNTISGLKAIAIGEDLIVKTQNGFAIGAYNDSLGANKIFEIGNGFDDASRNNAVTVLANGNMGINTKSPSQKLDIIGKIKITDSSQGAGKVLTSDANGVGTWQSFAIDTNATWNTAGNYLGTNNKFLGSIDNYPISFKQNNKPMGSFNTITNNYAIGDSALHSPLNGVGNIAIGAKAMKSVSNNSVMNNIAIGTDALNKLSSLASNNIAIGKDAMYNLTNGLSNIAIGDSSNVANGATTKNNTIAIGSKALKNNVASSNIAIGANAMENVNLLAASKNIALGNASLQNAKTPLNIAIGDSALNSLSTGTQNIAIGTNAGAKNTTSSNNVSIGYHSLKVSKGFSNVSLGNFTLSQDTSSDFNVAIGQSALNTLLNGNNNTALGFAALSNSRTVQKNTAISSNSLFNHKTGDQNIAIGESSMRADTIGSGNIMIGNDVSRTDDANLRTIAIGHAALYSGNGGTNLVIGDSAMYSASNASLNIVIGKNALYNDDNGIGNIVLGNNTMKTEINGIDNLALGNAAMSNGTNNYKNIAIGSQAMYNSGNNALTLGDDDGNVALGNIAMYNSNGARGNVAIGTAALFNIGASYGNTAIGTNALLANTSTGVSNTALGFNSFSNLTTGDSNVAIGSNCFTNGPTQSRMTAIGANARTGGNNTSAIGYNARVTGTNKMSFGDSLVTQWTLGIHTGTVGNAFQVGYNATNGNGAFLTSGGAWTNTSDSSKKENVQVLNSKTTLDKINQLQITQWDYKNTTSKETHIGPMAQQFYDLFGTGVQGQSNAISTIDPAGVSLIGIQELSKQNQELSNNIKLLEQQLEELKLLIQNNGNK